MENFQQQIQQLTQVVQTLGKEFGTVRAEMVQVRDAALAATTAAAADRETRGKINVSFE